MKKILLVLACGLICPTFVDAQEAQAASSKKVVKRTATAKKTTAKAAKKTKTPRTKTTTAAAKPKATKNTKTTKASATKTKKPRTKTTTAGTKKNQVKQTKHTKSPKNATQPTAHRAKKTSYSSKAETKNPTKKAATTKPKVKRVYRKGGVTYRKFHHLNNATAQKLGQIKKPISKSISLNEPGRGYKNANHLTFTTQDGKTGHVLLDAHELTAARAERKGLNKLSHVGQQSVEVFAGSDDPAKGLALIGEFPLLNANLKGNDDLHIDVDPSGHVTLSGKNNAGDFEPITEFSIHQ